MSFSNQVIYGTTRIECRNGQSVSTGTGFYHECARQGERAVFLIVTNRHVVEGYDSATVQVNTSADRANIDRGEHVSVTIPNLQDFVFYHPDPSVDLAAIPLSPIIETVERSGKRPLFQTTSPNIIARDELLEDLRAVEDVLMVGYPNGLWDEVNNLPLMRTGITSTPLTTDFQGRSEFVIDCACFPGSSGSPVFLYQSGMYYSKTNNRMNMGERFALLGVLWGGPHYTAEGQIVVRTVPSAAVPASQTRINLNLGYCIKASQLDAFQQHFDAILQAELTARPEAQS